MIRVDPAPVELGRKERGFRARIGNLRHPFRIGELRKAREFLAPSLAHGLRQFPVEVAEEQKWLRRAPFLAHEQHRDLGSEQIDACKRADGFGRSQRVQPFAERAIADLVVILDE